MNDFERGQLAVHVAMGNIANETANFREGYTAFTRATHGVGTLFALVLDVKASAEEDDPEGFSLGFEAGRETLRQLRTRSKDFQAGWAHELQRPVIEKMKALSTEERIARRAEVLFQDHKTLEAHVEYKMAMKRDPNQRTVSAPLTLSLDELERAYIKALAQARDLKHRVDAKVQAHHVASGKGEFVILTNDGGTIPADPELIRAKIREARADIGGGKDATWPNLEFRNGPTGDA
jgi:hypothetical protein